MYCDKQCCHYSTVIVSTCYCLLCYSVRFGLVGGVMRLLIACQDSGIYIFETGQGPTGTASNDLPCQELFIGREEAEGALNEQNPSARQREV